MEKSNMGITMVMNRKALSNVISVHQNLRKMNTGNCPKCQGYGYTSEHDPLDPHVNGECCTCPIQVQCETCHATGHVSEHMLTILNRETKQIAEDNDLPF